MKPLHGQFIWGFLIGGLSYFIAGWFGVFMVLIAIIAIDHMRQVP